MRILFTGAGSFTGYWFVRERVAAGHEVVAACRGEDRREGLRGERLRMGRELYETRFSCAFGNDNFLAKTSFDVLCHHVSQIEKVKVACSINPRGNSSPAPKMKPAQLPRFRTVL
jgi:UDP-glucose 4-epimerase